MKFIGMITMALFTQAIDFGEIILLPPANMMGAISLEENLAQRR